MAMRERGNRPPDVPTLISRSARRTRRVARRIGALVQAPFTIALKGDLGSGKTVFVQGLAAGLGVPAAFCVTSPTYTLVNEYPGRCVLYHVDLYRLAYPADLAELGLEDTTGREGVVAVEWADRMDAAELAPSLEVCFKTVAETERWIQFSGCSRQFADLIRGVIKQIEEQQWG